ARNLDRSVRTSHGLLAATGDDFLGFNEFLLAELLRKSDSTEEGGRLPEFGLFPLGERMIVALGAAQVDAKEKLRHRACNTVGMDVSLHRVGGRHVEAERGIL